MKLSLYDDQVLARQARVQREKAWDLHDSFDWKSPLDLNKPLIPLDDKALLFPGASAEERLAISQVFGLIVATSISEMEEALLRLRQECWVDIREAHPVSPEFDELGDLFFEEERKHSQSFDMYVDKFSEETNVDPHTLRSVLPVIEGTRTERYLKKNITRLGQGFWWIVASVEQEFLMIYKALEPFKEEVEPLYFDLHYKHFLEEARHAGFPYLMLDLMISRHKSLSHPLRVKTDLALSQVLTTLWTVSSLNKIRNVRKIQHKHPLFEALAHAIPLLERQPTIRILWQMMTQTPYISSLLHPRSHQKIVRQAEKTGAFILPYPEYNPQYNPRGRKKKRVA